MTLNQAFEIALTYARAECQKPPRSLLCYFADVAQKEIALDVSHITKRFDVSKTNSKPKEYDMPPDSIGVHKLIRRASALPVNYCIDNNGRLVISDYGNFDIYYKVLPETIDENTPDDYRFAVDVKAHAAIPFYIAYRIAADENVAQDCLSKWNRLNSLVKLSVPKTIKIRYSDYYL